MPRRSASISPPAVCATAATSPMPARRTSSTKLLICRTVTSNSTGRIRRTGRLQITSAQAAWAAFCAGTSHRFLHGNGTEPHIVTFCQIGRSSHVPAFLIPQRLVRERLDPDVSVLRLDPRSTGLDARATSRCPRPRCQPPRGTQPGRPICGTTDSPTTRRAAPRSSRQRSPQTVSTQS